jgi:hypothetical protein
MLSSMLMHDRKINSQNSVDIHCTFAVSENILHRKTSLKSIDDRLNEVRIFLLHVYCHTFILSPMLLRILNCISMECNQPFERRVVEHR